MRELLVRLGRWRFARFATVGALGTVVNLVVLWAGQEWLLAGLQPESLRLTLALTLSIAVSTVHNFLWNRAWTWSDRARAAAGDGADADADADADDRPSLVAQFGQYALACWFGILLQFILTRTLSDAMHYMAAATLAIGLASVVNYAINDLWTFGRRLLAAPSARLMLAVQIGLVALTAWAYLHGLDGRHIPKNGDELVYAHITRTTAATGHWLPLASDLDGMRNTKPPLLFWQGLVSTGFGAHWDLWRLRWPSVAWTALTALVIGLTAARLAARSGGGSSPGVPAPIPARAGFDLPAGLVAALVWLGFFTTFRYGRPYLTNPPEVFWLSAPLLAMLWAWPRPMDSRLAWPLGLGLAIGIGLFAKSFALLAPVGAVVTLWWWRHRGWRLGEALRRDAPRLVLMGAVALGVFALWFALDPDPAAVWREFVVGENLGKMDNRGNPAVTFFTGPDSVWEYGLASLLNAGLLVGVVVALAGLGWRRRRVASDDERRLWIWFAVFFVVFAIPSQRSARYLMPAMPALALLAALHWRTLPAWSLRLGHAFGLLVVLLFAWLALGLQDGAAAGLAALPESPVPPVAWAVFLLAATTAVAGLAVKAVTRTALLATVALVHLAIGVFLAPFDGRFGEFPAAARAQAAGRTVWVPCNFRATFEAHAFLLPGAVPRGWDERGPGAPRDPAQLAERYPLFAWRQPLHAPPPSCDGCTVLGDRLDLRSRHSGAEIRAMLTGDAVAQLFTREWLVQASPRPSHAAHATEAACR